MKNRPWDEIEKELSSCQLLCKNCHGEHHNPECDTSSERYEKDYSGYKVGYKVKVATGQCLICQKDVFGTKYCSQGCARIGSRKINRPKKEELSKLINEKTWVEIGLLFNISDNAVRKWAKNYGLI